MSVNLIVAHDESMVIGKDGKLPWHLPGDMKHFKASTEGHAVLMGRKTWESLPEKFRPLPKRLNLVVSSNAKAIGEAWRQTHPTEPGVAYDGPHFFESIPAAILFFKSDGLSLKYPDLWIIGGERVYRDSLAEQAVDRVVVSLVPGTHEGDAYFPKLDETWEVASREPREGFEIVQYARKAAG